MQNCAQMKESKCAIDILKCTNEKRSLTKDSGKKVQIYNCSVYRKTLVIVNSFN